MVDELGLSLQESSHNDEIGLSLCIEENTVQEDELGQSIDMSYRVDISVSSVKHDFCGTTSYNEEQTVYNIEDASVVNSQDFHHEKYETDVDLTVNSEDELGTSFVGHSMIGEGLERGLLVPLDSSTPSRSMSFGRLFAKTPSRNMEKKIQKVNRQEPKMRKKAMDLIDIKRTLGNMCTCGRFCFKTFNVKTVSFERYLFWSKPVYLRMYWLVHALRNSETVGRYRFLRLENEKQVCFKAFLKILRVNKNSYSLAKSLYHRQALTNKGNAFRSESETTMNAVTWLEEYASNYGDRMPNSEDVLLPQKSQKQSIYNRYKLEKSMHNASPVWRSQFYKIWKTRFPHLKIRQTNPFSKCTTCFALERCEENELMTHTRGAIGDQRVEHHDRQMCERRYYYAKKEKSRTNPDKFMSIIIDGMDQSKTSLPHFAGRLAKSINCAALLKTHVTGIINHGHGGFHTYIDFNQYQHDPNLTINVILKALKRAADRNGNQLPPTLYVQADNCWRENKNRYVFSFLQLLVERNIFDEVHLSFLYVGHTHEDVDQAFSVYSRALRKTDIETLPDFLLNFHNSVLLEDLYDVKSWLLPHMEDLVHVSKPLHFKFSRSAEKTDVHYKGQFNSEWIVLESNFLEGIPSGKPTLLKPNYEKIDTVSNLKQIHNMKTFFKKAESIQYWEDFYKNIEKKKRKTASTQWILDVLPRQPQKNMEDIVVTLPQHIRQLVEKDTQVPKITLKRKQNPKRKQATQKTQKQQKKSRGKSTGRKKSGDCRQYTVKGQLIPIDSEIKRHIWIIIFMDLFGLCFIKFILLLFLILVTICCLQELINYLQSLLFILLQDHLGSYTASISKDLVVADSWMYVNASSAIYVL